MLELAVHVFEDLLPARLEGVEAHFGGTNRNAFLGIAQPLPSGVCKFIEGHTQRSAVLDIRLMFGVMQLSYGRGYYQRPIRRMGYVILTLHCGWQDLDDLDISFSGLLQLEPQ